MFCACSFHGDFMNNLLVYCGLVDARKSASEKDLPVVSLRIGNEILRIFHCVSDVTYVEEKMVYDL